MPFFFEGAFLESGVSHNGDVAFDSMCQQCVFWQSFAHSMWFIFWGFLKSRVYTKNSFAIQVLKALTQNGSASIPTIEDIAELKVLTPKMCSPKKKGIKMYIAFQN